MLVELLQVTTADGVRLHGSLQTPPAESLVDAARHPVDVWLCIHGTGSNFYAASMFGALAPKLLGPAAVLRVNTRGHDMICTGPSTAGRVWQGAAFERVSESPLDLVPWLELLRQRRFQRIGIVGHSLGAVKAIYTLAHDPSQKIAALVGVSPPRLSHSNYLASPRADVFRRQFAIAQKLVESGRGDEIMLVDFPLKYFASATAYVDRYGPGETYNVIRLLDRLTCPTLLTFGSRELAETSFRGSPEDAEALGLPANRLKVAVVADADHFYTGCHDALAGRIASWLAKLPASDPPDGGV